MKKIFLLLFSIAPLLAANPGVLYNPVTGGVTPNNLNPTVNGLTVTAGITNNALTASKLMATGANKQETSVADVAALETLLGSINLIDSTEINTTTKINTLTTDDDFATLNGTQSMANKTLVTPTIASLANATHTHQNAAGGGTLAEAALALTDITTGNASTSAHGFQAKADGNANHVYKGDGTQGTIDAAAIGAGTVALARLPVAASGVSDATKLVRADDSRLGAASAANWNASGSTNSTLAGTAFIWSLSLTSSITIGDGTTAGFLALGDTGGKYYSISPQTFSTSVNYRPPAAPFTGIGKYAITSVTNWTESAATAGSDYADPATTLTIAGTANEITSSAGAQSLAANRTWTLSLPSALTFTGKTITGGTYSSPTLTTPALGVASATSVDIGNADTTLTRASAGDINIEGNIAYRAGGTKVSIGDGGTGQGTAIAALDALITAEADVASATTTDLGAATTKSVRITGTTTITSFGTVTSGVIRKGRFAGALTLTHSATALILPGAANIATAANDRFEAMSLGSGNWLVYFYQKADGTAIVGAAGGGDFSSNTGTSVDSEVVLFSGTGGKTGKRATGTGVAHLTSGVLSASTVTVAEGGTGIASGTSGGVPYFSGTTTIASSAALAANALVIGGGAGVAPSTTTTGSGVLTALGVAANGSGGFLTDTGSATVQNKIAASTWAGGNNTLTARRYLPLQFTRAALTSMIVNSNDFSLASYGRVRFPGNSTATNSNYAIFRSVVPIKFVGASGQDLTIEKMTVKTTGTQTGAFTFNIGVLDISDSAAADPADSTSFGNYVSVTSATLTSPAANDRFSKANVTLTGWRSALTAGDDMAICVVRNDTNTDGMDLIDVLISYVETQ